jgi:DNA processing protein
MLGVPARRLRALALGDDGALRDWIANESAYRLALTRRDVGAVLEAIDRAGAHVVTLADAAFPEGLRDLADPPPFLIVRGTLPPSARGGRGTAIIGSRDADPAAADFARAFAALCAPPVVSGLAAGIDAAAHHGALDAGVPQVAYVGHGLGATYPPGHTELENAIVAGGGAVAGERLPGEAVNRWALVRRDRLQAAHAREIVLLQSEAKGGAMHTMRFAQRLGRTRRALSPRAGAAYEGNAIAIREGAVELDWTLPRGTDGRLR